MNPPVKSTNIYSVQSLIDNSCLFCIDRNILLIRNFNSYVHSKLAEHSSDTLINPLDVTVITENPVTILNSSRIVLQLR